MIGQGLSATSGLGAPLQGLVGGSGGLDGALPGLQRLQERGGADSEQEAASVGEEFEKLFATLLVKEMRKSAKGLGGEDGGFFGKGAGADIYEGWFDQHVGAQLASENALGLVGLVKAGLGNVPETEAPAAMQTRAGTHAQGDTTGVDR